MKTQFEHHSLGSSKDSTGATSLPLIDHLHEKRKPAHKDPDPPVIDHLLARVIILGLLLILTAFWADRHFGELISDKSGRLPLLSLLFPILMGICGKREKKDSKEDGEAEHSGFSWSTLAKLLAIIGLRSDPTKYKKKIRAFVRFFLLDETLAIAWCVFLAASFMVSSITLDASSSHGPMKVELLVPNESASSEPKELAEKDTSIHFVRWSNPLGRAYSLKVEGYQPYQFDLFPWIGRRINLDRDLAVAPSVLVRLPLSRLPQVIGGRIELFRLGSKLPFAGTNTSELHAAVIFGRSLPLPAQMLADWQSELRIATTNERSRDLGFLSWRHPVLVPIRGTITAGEALEARFITPNGETSISVHFVVTPEPLQDIPIPDSIPSML